MAEYTVELISRAEREARIKKARSSPVGSEKLYDFRNTPVDLPVIQLPIGLLVYRMENFRTFTDQRELTTSQKLPFDYFTSGQEIESVQQIQHRLLAKLARKRVSDSVVPVIDVLREQGQRLPLLISSSGVVVNGNRRLAGMRELLAEDEVGYAAFNTINCAVLPEDATVEEIVDIEASLQAQPETKLEYDWIGDAQLVSRLVTLHKGTAVVAARLNRSEKEIKNVLLALAEADLYLKDWAKAEGEYSRVTEDGEQLFKDLPKQLEGKDASMQTASRAIAWTLFDNRAQVPGRIYSFNPAFGKLAGQVLNQVAQDLGLSSSAAAPAADDGSFAVDIDTDDASSGSLNQIVETLRSSKGDSDVAEIVIDAAQAAIEHDKGQKSGRAALNLVGQAHTKLKSVDITKAAPDSRPAMKKQLESIQEIVTALLEKLASIDN